MPRTLVRTVWLLSAAVFGIVTTGAALVGAVPASATPALPSGSSSNLSQRITVDGLQCGTESFDVDALGPSFRGANEYRWWRLDILGGRALALSADTPTKQPDSSSVSMALPGYATVVEWWKRQEDTWPEIPGLSDPMKSLQSLWQRVGRMSKDDEMESESIRALAHQHCVVEMGDLTNVVPIVRDKKLAWPNGPTGRLPQHFTECSELVTAEGAADKSLESRLKLARALPEKPTDAKTTELLLTFATNESLLTPKVTVEWQATKDSKATAEIGSPLVAALVAQSATVKTSTALKTTLTMDASAYQEAASLAEFYSQLWCSLHGGNAAPVCSAPRPVAGFGSMGRQAWSKATPEIVHAARKIPFPTGATAPPGGYSDEKPFVERATALHLDLNVLPEFPTINGGTSANGEKLQSRMGLCKTADFYVSPTHDIEHRTSPYQAGWRSRRFPNPAGENDVASANTFTVCIDTESFSVEKPVQVVFSTSSKNHITFLWPGQLYHLNLVELAGPKPEVMHITVRGYPRRDLLRAVAKNPGGPLEKTDIFTYIEQAQAAEAQTAQATAADLKAFAKVLAGEEETLKKVSAVADDLALPLGVDHVMRDEKKPSPLTLENWKKEVRTSATTALQILLQEGKKQSSAVQTAFEKLLPLPSDIALAIAPSDLAAAAQKIVQIFTAMNADPPSASVAAPVTASGVAPAPTAASSGASASAVPSPAGSAAAPASAAGAAAPASAKPDANLAAIVLCQLTSTLVPLVTDDVLLLPPTEPSSPCCTDAQATSACNQACPVSKEGPYPKNEEPYILSYDFKGGFQRALSDEPMSEKQPLFVVVHNVEPGWSIGVSINNKSVIQRNVSLIGMTSTPELTPSSFEDRTSQANLGFDHINPSAIEMQPPSTQIVSLGNLGGGARYDIVVCASNQLYDDCTDTSKAASGAGDVAKSPAPSAGASAPSPSAAPAASTALKAAATHRVIAKNSMIVHSKHFLGVRAGLGLDWSWSNTRDAVSLPGSTATVVRQDPQEQTDLSLPLLLTYYPCGRDSTEMPRGFSFGLAGGLDLLKIGLTPRVYAGVVLDYAGFGLTLAASDERYSTVSLPEYTVIPAGITPQTDYSWIRPGFLVSLTTDADIFQAIYTNYIQSAQFPTTAPPGGL
jgi:hypothetical protein